MFAEVQKRRWMPDLRTVGCYHDHPSHIAALANSVRRHWAVNGRGEHLLMSFHGVPQHYVTKGDPYYCQCQKTGRLLAEALGLKAALTLPLLRAQPAFEALGGRHAAVHGHHRFGAKTGLYPFLQLGREVDLGHHHQRLRLRLPLQQGLHAAQIDLGLAAARGAKQQKRPGLSLKLADGPRLLWGECY